jgi:hypothetical protein
MRRRDIEGSPTRMASQCPLKGGIASLEVPDIYTIGNKKFDNRIFVLVPSIKVNPNP